jgi:RNA polymerase sigma-70 factor (ECF subfamily)
MPEDGNLKAWVCTIAARVCLDNLRKKRVATQEMPDDDIAPGAVASAEDEVLARHRVREIETAIGKLPHDQRIALVLRDMHGLSYEEMAEAISQPIGTVKSRLSRARSALVKGLS